MNDLLVTLGIESWKPTLESLLMPPVPFVLMVLIGARLMYRRRAIAWTLIAGGALGMYFMCTTALGGALTNMLLQPPRALSAHEIADLKRQPHTAILVLGGGRKLYAPEYGVSNLKSYSLERLRFGLWLSRETGLPVGFSGGVGHGGEPGASEAEIAGRIAEREFGRPLKWMETQSRDTNENAMHSLPMLKEGDIQTVVLVTHGFHMRRALAAFERAHQRTGIPVHLIAAPIGLEGNTSNHIGDWLPSVSGFEATRLALHEWVGRLAGA